MEIKSAPDDRVRLYPNEVARILKAVGHPEAYVTDWSSIEDLTDLSARESARLRAVLGIPVPTGSLIADLAAALAAKQAKG
jgi:hypothetical protein